MKKMQNLLLLWLLLGFAVLAASGCSDSSTGQSNDPSGVLEVSGAYVRMPPPGMKMTAAFATFANEGRTPVDLVGATSSGFASVSLHRTQIEQGVAKMRAVESVTIAPGAKLLLKPGGYHLMLMGSRKPLEPGGLVEVDLLLGDGSTQRIGLPVQYYR